MYGQFANKIKGIIDFDRIVINQIDEDTFINLSVDGVEVPSLIPGQTRDIKGTQLEEIIRTKSPTLIQTGDRDELEGKYPGLLNNFDAGIRSFLSVPLISNDTIFGSLSLRSTKLNAYTQSDVDLSLRVGDQIAGAISNSQLYAEQTRIGTELSESRARLNLITDNINEIVLLVDNRDYSVLFVNPAYEKIWGRTIQSLYDNPLSWVEAVHPDDLEKVNAAFLKQQTTGIFNEEFRIIQPDGAILWVHDRVLPIKESFEESNYLVGIIRDITFRKESEGALRESEEKFRLMAETISLGIEDIDVSGIITYANPAHHQMYGYEPGELIGKSILDLVSTEPGQEQLKGYLEVLVNEQLPPVPYFGQKITKQGEIIDVQVAWNYKKDADGQVVGFTSIITDITEQKKIETYLRQSQALRVMGELAAGIAHDINNELQAMVSLELALTEDMSPSVREYVQSAFDHSKTAAATVARLQRFAGQRNNNTNYSPISINALVEGAITQSSHIWKDTAQQTGISIELKTKFDGEFYILGDYNDLNSVLLNMINNSCQAMPDGGKIYFETRKDEKGVYLTVTDTGIGMENETKERIFQPFFSTKGFDLGKGMGMSQAYSIIREHNGEIYVTRSAPGKGTSIEILLPYAEKLEIQEKAPEIKYDGKARILWVDDEESIRGLASRFFDILGYTGDVAADGNEALELLAVKQYDLMLSDVGMPGMTGWGLAKAIKGKHTGMEVALITGWGDNFSENEKIEHGVDYVVPKPFHMDQLKNLVGTVMEHNQVQTG